MDGDLIVHMDNLTDLSGLIHFPGARELHVRIIHDDGDDAAGAGGDDAGVTGGSGGSSVGGGELEEGAERTAVGGEDRTDAGAGAGAGTGAGTGTGTGAEGEEAKGGFEPYVRIAESAGLVLDATEQVGRGGTQHLQREVV